MCLVIYVCTIDNHTVLAIDSVGSLYAFVSIVERILDIESVAKSLVAVKDELLLRNLCGDSTMLGIDGRDGTQNVGEGEMMDATFTLCLNNQAWQSV